MDFDQFLQSSAHSHLRHELQTELPAARVDLGRAATLDVNREFYAEADARGLTLSELLELVLLAWSVESSALGR